MQAVLATVTAPVDCALLGGRVCFAVIATHVAVGTQGLWRLPLGLRILDGLLLVPATLLTAALAWGGAVLYGVLTVPAVAFVATFEGAYAGDRDRLEQALTRGPVEAHAWAVQTAVWLCRAYERRVITVASAALNAPVQRWRPACATLPAALIPCGRDATHAIAVEPEASLHAALESLAAASAALEELLRLSRKAATPRTSADVYDDMEKDSASQVDASAKAASGARVGAAQGDQAHTRWAIGASADDAPRCGTPGSSSDGIEGDAASRRALAGGQQEQGSVRIAPIERRKERAPVEFVGVGPRWQNLREMVDDDDKLDALITEMAAHQAKATKHGERRTTGSAREQGGLGSMLSATGGVCPASVRVDDSAQVSAPSPRPTQRGSPTSAADAVDPEAIHAAVGGGGPRLTALDVVVVPAALHPVKLPPSAAAKHVLCGALPTAAATSAAPLPPAQQGSVSHLAPSDGRARRSSGSVAASMELSSVHSGCYNTHPSRQGEAVDASELSRQHWSNGRSCADEGRDSSPGAVRAATMLRSLASALERSTTPSAGSSPHGAAHKPRHLPSARQFSNPLAVFNPSDA